MKKLLLLLTVVVFTTSIFAAETITTQTATKGQQPLLSIAGSQPVTLFQRPSPFTVTLLKLKFSPDMIKILQQRVSQLQSTPSPDVNQNILPPYVNLGMNGIPILDQGMHGTCVTFAITAALDAIIGHGDYISQLCSLEIGQYLNEYGYVPSGWDGADATDVFAQFKEFGIINKTWQYKGVCEGVTQYPVNNIKPNGKPMPLTDYRQYSEDITHLSTNISLFNSIEMVPIYSLMELQFYRKPNINNIVSDIKSALAQHQRIVLGFIVDMTDPLAGKYKVEHDTWVLTPKIMFDIGRGDFSYFGHEIVIYGYDDNAVAYDSHGIPHKGLFYVRNSWGIHCDDNGKEYMSYDYLKVMSDEAYRMLVLSLPLIPPKQSTQ